MPLSEAAVALLRGVLEDREALLDRATDHVYGGSPDLAGKRPRLVTRMLIDRTFACFEAALLRDDDSELERFIDQITGMRAESDYHVSTMLSGVHSFRFALQEPARALAGDGWIAWELITAADALYMRASPRAATLLLERQHAATLERTAAAERKHLKLLTQLRLSEELVSALRAERQAATALVARLEREQREKSALLDALIWPGR